MAKSVPSLHRKTKRLANRRRTRRVIWLFWIGLYSYLLVSNFDQFYNRRFARHLDFISCSFRRPSLRWLFVDEAEIFKRKKWFTVASTVAILPTTIAVDLVEGGEKRSKCQSDPIHTTFLRIRGELTLCGMKFIVRSISEDFRDRRYYLRYFAFLQVSLVFLFGFSKLDSWLDFGLGGGWTRILNLDLWERIRLLEMGLNLIRIWTSSFNRFPFWKKGFSLHIFGLTSFA